MWLPLSASPWPVQLGVIVLMAVLSLFVWRAFVRFSLRKSGVMEGDDIYEALRAYPNALVAFVIVDRVVIGWIIVTGFSRFA